MNATLTTILALVPEFLRTVAVAFNGTTLANEMDRILNTGAALIEVGDSAATELAAFTAQIKAMADTGKDPTEAEWDALRARSDAAHALIQGASAPATNASPP